MLDRAKISAHAEYVGLGTSDVMTYLSASKPTSKKKAA
jgi:hypothetical protein